MKTLLVAFLLSFCSATGFSQQWQYTGSLSCAKRFVIFTTLDNGKVLCSGGMMNDVPHAECELYDPATGTWSLTGSLHVGRYLQSVVKLKDGRVAVFGGQSGGNSEDAPIQTDVIEIFDPSTGVWSIAGHLNIAREHQTASLLSDGRVLIAGGLVGNSPTATAEIFDPSTDSCVLVAPMQQARYEHQATSLLDGRVMVTGGRIGGWDGTFFNESEIYDPATNTWTVIEPMHQPRMRALLVQFSDGSILSAAGRNAALSTAPGSELYDLSTGHWSETDSMKVPVTWLSCVLLPDDRYLATGGDSAFGIANTEMYCTATTEWYDKPNQRWFFAPTMNQARSEHSSAYLHQTVNDSLPEDMVIVGGGMTGPQSYTSTCEILDVGNSAMTEYKAMPINTESEASILQNANSNSVSVSYDAKEVPTIHYSTASPEAASVRIVAMDGRIVANYDEGSLPAGSYDLTLSGTGLPTGTYIAIIQMGAARTIQKIMIFH